jgi:hypothetical protein
MTPDFHRSYTKEGTFLCEEIFDFEEWHTEDTYMKVVRENENYDLLGNKKLYSMHDKFQMCILATYESDDQIVRLTKKIPHVGEFEKLIVER